MTESPHEAARPGSREAAPPKTYERRELRVVWEAARCIHTAKCIQALPQVFDPQARPWVRVDAAPAEEVAAAVRACPTGALRYEAVEVEPEAPEPVTTVRVSPDGPLLVRGAVTVDGGGTQHTGTRLALCRCGATGNPPFCDNSHRAVGFSGGPLTTRDEGDVAEGPCTLTYDEPGPYAVKGPCRVVSPSGKVLSSGGEHWLCRCGRSGSKPFCDGSHNRPKESS